MDFDSAYRALLNQRINAGKKRVPFEINFKQWLDLWGDHIDQRGKLQLQRKDKALGYVEGNLRIGERPRKACTR